MLLLFLVEILAAIGLVVFLWKFVAEPTLRWVTNWRAARRLAAQARLDDAVLDLELTELDQEISQYLADIENLKEPSTEKPHAKPPA